MVVAYSQNFNSLKSQDVSENQAKDIAGEDTTYFQEREIHKNHGAVVSSRFLEFLFALTNKSHNFKSRVFVEQLRFKSRGGVFPNMRLNLGMVITVLIQIMT